MLNQKAQAALERVILRREVQEKVAVRVIVHQDRQVAEARQHQEVQAVVAHLAVLVLPEVKAVVQKVQEAVKSQNKSA